MSANEKAAFILTILGILGATFKMLQWLIRTETSGIIQKEVPDLVRAELHIVNYEMQNNGGGSAKDKIDYIFKYIKGQENGTEG